MAIRPESGGSDASSHSSSSSSLSHSGSDVGGVAKKGTAQRPYRLLIAGGGPAGYSILVRALRLDFFDELCGGSSDGNVAGVCVVDSGKANRLGGGRLQDYLISSNTFAVKFYSHVMAPQPTNLPPETIAGTTLERLEDSGSYAGAALRNYAHGNEAPLSLVGSWLKDVANEVGEALKKYPSSSSCISEMKVTKIQRVRRTGHSQVASSFSSPPKVRAPSVVVAAAAAAAAVAEQESVAPSSSSSTSSATTNESRDSSRLSPTSCGDDDDEWQWRVTCSSSSDSTLHEQVFYAQKVALATGGRQELPTLPSTSHTAKLIASDRAITLEGLTEIRDKLANAPKRGAGNTCPRIVIVGGSHSAFSAAWICLNKLNLAVPGEGIAVHNDEAACANSHPPGSICILHRSSVRVFYGSRREAEADNYDGFRTVHRNTGQIHPFGGLRADAKELWRNIRTGRESRVRMLKATTQQSIANKLFDDAAVIIWACGYSTNLVSVLDEDGSRIPIRLFRGQVEVDNQGRLLLDAAKPITGSAPTSASALAAAAAAARPVGGLYGIGLGYGFKATFGSDKDPELDGSSGRADGVAVYLKRGATLVLAATLGPQVFGQANGRQLMSWEERNSALKKCDEDGGTLSVPSSPVPTPLLSPTRSSQPPLSSSASPLSPLRRVSSALSESMSATTSSDAGTTSATAAARGATKPTVFPPIVSRSSTAIPDSRPSLRQAAQGLRASVIEAKRERMAHLQQQQQHHVAVSVFADAGALAASVARLSKPRPQSVIRPQRNGPVSGSNLFSPVKTPKTEAGSSTEAGSFPLPVMGGKGKGWK